MRRIRNAQLQLPLVAFTEKCEQGVCEMQYATLEWFAIYDLCMMRGRS
jgi:hypothetical protein